MLPLDTERPSVVHSGSPRGYPAACQILASRFAAGSPESLFGLLAPNRRKSDIYNVRQYLVRSILLPKSIAAVAGGSQFWLLCTVPLLYYAPYSLSVPSCALGTPFKAALLPFPIYFMRQFPILSRECTTAMHTMYTPSLELGFAVSVWQRERGHYGGSSEVAGEKRCRAMQGYSRSGLGNGSIGISSSYSVPSLKFHQLRLPC